ncbi:MAG: M4 family metallopeptidase [Bacteroidia bacterium]
MTKTYLCLKTCLFALALLCGINAHAGEIKLKDAEITSYAQQTGLPNTIRFHAGSEPAEAQVPAWTSASLGLDKALNLVAFKQEQDELGFTTTRYREYFNSFPVEATMLIAHSKNGKVISINGDYVQHIGAATAPALTEVQALKAALTKVNAKKYYEKGERNTFKAELVVVHRKKDAFIASAYRLAYKFNIYAEIPLYRANVFVDAVDGTILDEQNLICTADVLGTGVTKFSGTVPMTSDNYGTGQFRLRETARGNGIQTYDLRNGSTYVNTDFTNTSSTWNLAGNDQAAADAHWGAEMTYDYYKNVHGRNSIDNAGYNLLSYVHYSTNFVNAYWDGTEMTYGDGDVTQGFLIMTALDVCGHEITHGLTNFTAALNGGGTDEASALNEGFSDIFGTTIEAFARPSQHDWIMGGDITCSTSGVQNHAGIRDMSNPKSLGQPNTYLGTNWDPNGECHNNNGPCIYWYYLLCQGGSGTNDIGSAYTVNALTMNTAQMIAFRGLTKYFTPSTAYADARAYTIQAAIDLYGACSNEVQQTTNAWYAVGVGPAYASTLAVNFDAASVTSCSLPDSVHFANTTAGGSSFTWSFGDGTVSNATNPVHAYTQNGVYTVKLSATGCGTSSNDSIIKTGYITVSAPAAPTATGGSGCTPASIILNASGSGTLTWLDSAGNIVGTGSTYTTPGITHTSNYYVTSSSVTTPVSGGPATNTTLGTGGSLNTPHYLIFNASSAFTLQTVDVYAAAATGSTPTVTLSDSTGTVITSMPLNLTVAGKNTVTLNFHVNPGNKYQLSASGANINLYRNNAGAVYPINVASLASITGTDVTATAPAYYYWFYNWVLKKDPCQSAAVPVTATVNACAGIAVFNINEVRVYPNPAQDAFTITNLPEEVSLKLFDATGKLVYANNSKGGNDILITTSDWAEGLYFLSLTSGDKTSMHKLVVQH